MSFWSTLRTGASALTAQQLRLDIISNNIANAETTRTEEGGPYQRKDVVFIPQGTNTFLPEFIRARHEQDGNTLLSAGNTTQDPETGVRVAAIVTDDTPGAVVYDPTHPDANEEGFVEYPNVNIAVEMTNMLSATRSYEANLTVIEAAKRMALKALEIGR
ncbi:MAG: flagellar basal body rod protein FlgC [Anaerolineales bacterium]|nr:flagellar basal body rod protein FlgC [Anaerolineales bacterium]